MTCPFLALAYLVHMVGRISGLIQVSTYSRERSKRDAQVLQITLISLEQVGRLDGSHPTFLDFCRNSGANITLFVSPAISK